MVIKHYSYLNGIIKGSVTIITPKRIKKPPRSVLPGWLTA